MDTMDTGDEYDQDLISTEMLGNISNRSQSHTNVNMRLTRYKICDCSNQRKTEWKGVLKTNRNMGKGLHKLFKTVVKETSQYLSPLGESVSEVFNFIP